MNRVKLEFSDTSYLNALMNDKLLIQEIQYMNPKQLTNISIGLDDPVTTHTVKDSEMVVLATFARAIKRLFFANTPYEIEFLNPIIGQQKGGVHHNGTVVIQSTEI